MYEDGCNGEKIISGERNLTVLPLLRKQALGKHATVTTSSRVQMMEKQNFAIE